MRKDGSTMLDQTIKDFPDQGALATGGEVKGGGRIRDHQNAKDNPRGIQGTRTTKSIGLIICREGRKTACIEDPLYDGKPGAPSEGKRSGPHSDGFQPLVL